MKARLARISRRTWIILGSVLGVLIVVVLIFGRGRAATNTTFQTTKAGRGTLTATVGATGTVRALQSAVLIWQAAGTVDEVNRLISVHISEVKHGISSRSVRKPGWAA